MTNVSLKSPGIECEFNLGNSFGQTELDNTIQRLIKEGVTYETIVGALKKEFQEQLK